MEVTPKSTLRERIANIFLKERSHFLSRREIDWKLISRCALAALFVGVIGILLIPADQDSQAPFSERDASYATRSQPSVENSDPTQEALDLLSGSAFSRSASHPSKNLYGPQSAGGGPEPMNDQNSSMILARDGRNSKTHLPPGVRIPVRLYEKTTVANQGRPVIGIVTRDYIHENAIALPQASKLFGEISYDGGNRAQISWQAVQFPDGRERQFAAIGVGLDGQIGVLGKIHSEALKNTLGQTLTRFIGAYAEGSMQTGALGTTPGGTENGWKNAIAETAKDRAESWADDLKEEKSWIEVSNATEFYAVLTESFAFRDPGAVHGR